MHQLETHGRGRRSRVEICIDLFVAETGYVPEDAHPVMTATELSPQLERFVSTIRAPSAWRAWAAGPRGWFVEGRLKDSPGASAYQPSLMLTFRDHDARAAASGLWRRTAAGRWEMQQTPDWSSVSGVKH